MLTQIWSATDIIFCHFRPFLVLLQHYSPRNLKFGKMWKTPWDIILLHMCTVNQDHTMYGSWDIKCKGQNFGHFCLLILLTTHKINFEKIKKTPGGIIILNMSTINENHRMYDSIVMEHDRHNVLSFCTIFCPFTPPPP